MHEAAIGAPAVLRAADRPRPLLPVRAAALGLRTGSRTLLEGIDLTLRAGQITVVLGANGAGKSLFVRLLHGLLVPTAGAVLWNDAPLDMATRKRQAMVFQKPVLLRRSVAANIDFVLGARGARNAARRDAMLAEVGLLEQAAQPARLLSGGEQQRLALARALATAPDVLFLDEPTASLDPASVLGIEKRVLAAHHAGTKIIFITHDVVQARRLADDVVFLHGGRLLEHAPAERFFARPASEAAQDYLSGRIAV